MTTAVVMAGGRGARMGWHVLDRPKALLRYRGLPIIEHIVSHLRDEGVERIFVSTHYKGHMIEEYLGSDVEYLREEVPLGTAGGLSLLPPMTEPVIVVMGDVISYISISALLEEHEPVLSVGVSSHTYCVPYGVVALRGELVTDIEERSARAWDVAAGCYVFSPELLDRIPKRTIGMPELVRNTIAAGLPVKAVTVPAGKHFSTPEDLGVRDGC